MFKIDGNEFNISSSFYAHKNVINGKIKIFLKFAKLDLHNRMIILGDPFF